MRLTPPSPLCPPPLFFSCSYFFWLHRENQFGYWPDVRLHRAWKRQVALLEAMDEAEYKQAMSRGWTEQVGPQRGEGGVRERRGRNGAGRSMWGQQSSRV